MKLTEITFVIAVRKGSIRVKNKNVRKFHNSSLLEVKLNQIRRLFPNSEILLSTNCQKSVLLGKKYNCRINHRPKKYCSNIIPMKEVYSYIAKNIKTKFICYLHVTSPLFSDNSLKRSIKTFINKYPEYKSLASVSLVKDYLWFKNKPINYDYLNHPKSQDLPKYFSLNFAINIISKKTMEKKKLLVEKGFLPYVLNFPEDIDVDSSEDFYLAEYFYKNKSKNNI